jgi:hypothetical protein
LIKDFESMNKNVQLLIKEIIQNSKVTIQGSQIDLETYFVFLCEDFYLTKKKNQEDFDVLN